MSKDLESAV